VDLSRSLDRLRREERGIALIELLITAVMLNVVLFAILGLLDVSARAVPKDLERAAAIQESQAGLYRMTRDLRQAHDVVTPGTHVLSVNVFPGGTLTQVTYDSTASHPTTRATGAARAPSAAPRSWSSTGSSTGASVRSSSIPRPVTSPPP